MTEEIKTRCNIRENGIPMFSIDICGYLDATRPGSVRWAMLIQGEPSNDQLIAALERAKLSLMMDDIGIYAAEDDEPEDDFGL